MQKVIGAWKRILNLEWWRFQVSNKSSQVSSLQAKWLANEEKKRKRDYLEAGLTNTNPLLKEVIDKRPVSKALEAKEHEGEELPSSSTGQSKKQRREEQNEFSIGGMRNPAAAVARLHQVKKIGSQIHMAWMDFIKDHPKALEAAANYGSSEAKIDEKIPAEWSERLSSVYTGSDGPRRHHVEREGGICVSFEGSHVGRLEGLCTRP